MADLGSAAIGAAGNVAGGLVGSIANIFQAKKNRKFAREERIAAQQYQTAEREAQNAWNLEQWNRQNEYDLPINELQRMMDAGINPNNAINGIDGSTPFAASVANNGSAPSVINPSTPEFGSLLANGIGSSAREFAEIANINANTEKTKSETEGQDIQNKVNEKWLDKNMQMQYNRNFAELDKIMADAKVSDFTAEKILTETRTLIPSVVALNKSQQAKFWQETNLVVQQIANAIKTGKLIEEQQKTEQAKQTGLLASANASNAQAYYYQKEGERVNISNGILQAKKNIFDQTGVDVDGNFLNMCVQLCLSGDKGAETLDKVISTVKSMSDKIYQDGLDTGNIISDMTTGTLNDIHPIDFGTSLITGNSPFSPPWLKKANTVWNLTKPVYQHIVKGK